MRRVFALLLLCALAGCSFVRGSKLVEPERFGLELVTPQLYVQAGADAATRERLRLATQRAGEAVGAAYGDVESHPVVHACITESCYAAFGGSGSIAKVYGERILLSPRGLDWHFIAHEWSHAELQPTRPAGPARVHRGDACRRGVRRRLRPAASLRFSPRLRSGSP